MGIDAGIILHKKNIKDEDLTVDTYNNAYSELVFFGRDYHLHNILIDRSDVIKNMLYVGYSETERNADGSPKLELKREGEEKESGFFIQEPTHYLLDINKLRLLFPKLEALNKVTDKYSNRALDNLCNENIDDFTKKQLKEIDDALFDIDEEACYDDIFVLIRLYHYVYLILDMKDDDYDDKLEFIYWRS